MPFPRPWKIVIGILVAVLGVSVAIFVIRELEPTTTKPAQSESKPISVASLTLGQGHWGAVERGRQFLAKNRPDLALSAVMEVRDEKPGAGEAMAIAGAAFAQLGEVRTARSALERALKLQPKQADAARLAASLSLGTGDAVRGLNYLKLVTELEPQDAGVWELMGRVRHDLGEFGLSADAFAASLERKPDQPEIVVALINELLQAGRADEATRWLEPALKSNPNDAKLMGLAARQARDLGEADRGLSLAESTLAIDPNNFDALIVRAKTSVQAGNAQAAVKDLERAITQQPNDLRALQLLGQAESLAGLDDRSRATMSKHQAAQQRGLKMTDLMKQITNTPDDATLRVALGRLANEAGQVELAHQCYQAALQIDPQQKEAREAMAALPAESHHGHGR